MKKELINYLNLMNMKYEIDGHLLSKNFTKPTELSKFSVHGGPNTSSKLLHKQTKSRISCQDLKKQVQLQENL